MSGFMYAVVGIITGIAICTYYIREAIKDAKLFDYRLDADNLVLAAFLGFLGGILWGLVVPCLVIYYLLNLLAKEINKVIEKELQ